MITIRDEVGDIKQVAGSSWKRQDGFVISDEGVNYVPARFYNKELEDEHFEAHFESYPSLTQQQYVTEAALLVSSDVGGDIIGYSTDKGHIVRYNRRNNDFAKVKPGESGYLLTMFKPTSALHYYYDQKKKDWYFRKGKK